MGVVRVERPVSIDLESLRSGSGLGLTLYVKVVATGIIIPTGIPMGKIPYISLEELTFSEIVTIYGFSFGAFLVLFG